MFACCCLNRHFLGLKGRLKRFMLKYRRSRRTRPSLIHWENKWDPTNDWGVLQVKLWRLCLSRASATFLPSANPAKMPPGWAPKRAPYASTGRTWRPRWRPTKWRRSSQHSPNRWDGAATRVFQLHQWELYCHTFQRRCLALICP